jgi:SAM-dependent methyltransferase
MKNLEPQQSEPRANEPVTEYVPCDLCGSYEQELLYSQFDPVTRREYHLVECTCGMAFVNPMPTEATIPLLYPKDYLQHKDILSARYDRMLAYLPESRGRKLLDIGCGRGDFIEHASKSGWDVEGVDAVPWHDARDVPIRIGNFPEMDFSHSRYAAITAWASLEHVRKPSLFFGKVERLLADDGVFVFLVPNVSAPGMRRCCTQDVPRHLWLFTPGAASSYLDKYGMKVLAIHHHDRVYTSYPFGLVRYGFRRIRKKVTRCSEYNNKAVELLENRQIQGNMVFWMRDVVRKLGPLDVLIDTLDLAVGISVAKLSALMRNYGIITVIADKK